MIRKVSLILLLSAINTIVLAQQYQIFSATGNIEYSKNGSWEPAVRRVQLTMNDIVRVGKNSAVSILDEKNKKVYSYGKQGEVSVGNIVGAKSSALDRYVSRFSTSLKQGETDHISFDANVIYREHSADGAIYNALCNALSNTNYVSDYLLSMQLVDQDSGNEIKDSMRLGQRFFIRVTNRTSRPLFINVLSIDSESLWFDCLPIDQGLTMSHLLVPAQSTVDFREFPLETVEPIGLNRFILIAYDSPFDLRRVIDMYQKGIKASSASVPKVGITTKTINID